MDSQPDGVVPATPELAEGLARRLSPAHVLEIRMVSGLEPAAALRLSLAASLEAYAYVPKAFGQALFMMGVGESGPLTRSAVVWMLGSERLGRHPVGVLRSARWGIARAFAITGADRLEQVIPDWYATGLRFVERLGFSASCESDRFGAGGLMRVVLERGAAPVWKRDAGNERRQRWEHCQPLWAPPASV